MSTFFENNATLLLENPELTEAFQDITNYKTFKKNSILHKSGKVCKHFYIIISGIARVFYFKEDKDITCHFALEQESITAIDSFIQCKKSKYNIEALENLEVLAITHEDLESFFKKHPKYERFGRLFLQQSYIDLVQRIDDIQLHTSHERYEILLSKNQNYFKELLPNTLQHI